MVSLFDMDDNAAGVRRGRPVWLLHILATLAVVLGIGAAGLLLLLAATGAGGDEVETVTRLRQGQVVDLPARVSTSGDAYVAVAVEDASTTERRTAALRFIPILVVIVAMAWLLRDMLASVRKGDPFVATNVRRLRWVAILLLLGVPLADVLVSLGDQALAESAGLAGRGLRLHLPTGSLLGGLGMLVLVEVFALGTRMRDDLEGTV